jgi:hypothetical protein
MKSRAKRFSRALEPLKHEKLLAYAGDYDSKAEGIHAFEEFYRGLPKERRLYPYLALPDMLIGQRSCGKHNIIRCPDAVISFCEQCKINDMGLFAEESRQFIWKGQNYLEKMCSDITFLGENIVFSKYMEGFPTQNNPFLFPNKSSLANINASFGISNAVDLNVLDDFQNSQEKLRAAKCVVAQIYTDDSALTRNHSLAKNPYNNTEIGIAARRVKPKQLSLLYEPFPLPVAQGLRAFDLFDADLYRLDRLDSRLKRAQHILFFFCECVRTSPTEVDPLAATVSCSNEFISPAPGETLPVLAAYYQRGLQQTSLQYREVVAHRDESMFCRADEGEWASISFRSRTMRSLKFKDRLRSLGNELLREKRTVRATLKRLALSGIVEFDSYAAADTIARAKAVRGDFLDYDILKMESFLAARLRFIRAVEKLQSMFRSYFVRIRVKRKQLSILSRREAFINLLVEANTFSNTVVPACVNEAMRSQIKAQTKPLFRWVTNLSGSRVVISIGLALRRAGCESAEAWLIKTYDSATRQIFIATIDFLHIKRMTKHLLGLSDNFSEQTSPSLLIGSSYGALAPLFGPIHTVPTYAILLARIAAVKESSMLPLLPRIVSDLLRSRIVNNGVRGKNWEPFNELTSATKRKQFVHRQDSFLKHLADTSHSLYIESLRAREEYRTGELEWRHAEVEMVLGGLMQQDERLRRADDKIAAVMRASKDMLIAYESEIAQLKTDAAQSWESIERASTWKDLNRSRKIQQTFAKLQLEYEDRCESLQEGIVRNVSNGVDAEEKRLLAELYLKKHLAYQEVVQSIEQTSTDMKLAALEAAHMVVDSMSLLRKLEQRVVKYVDADFVHIRDPLQRCQASNRELIHLISFQIVPSSTTKETFPIRIYFDELTGYFVLELEAGGQYLEESCFYGDQALLKPTILAAAERNHEVLLTPANVLRLLLRHPHWPENKRAGYVVAPQRKCQAYRRFLSEYVSGVSVSDLPPLSSYTRRVRQRALDQDVISIGLRNLLRHNIFSGRICLGNHHLHLRSQLLEKFLVSSKWLSSALQRMTRIEVFKIIYPIAGVLHLSTIHFDGTHFTIRIDDLYNAPQLTVALSQVLISLRHKPFLLASFLLELTRYEFSKDIITHVLDYIDTTTSDELHHLWWRTPFEGEQLHLRYMTDIAMSFRGPIYTTTRIFANRVMSVRVYCSARGDLRLDFSPPAQVDTLGVYFTESPLSMLVSMVEIRALVIKYSVEKGIGILDPARKDELFDFIFEHIKLQPACSKGGYVTREDHRLLIREVLTDTMRFTSWAEKMLPSAILPTMQAALAEIQLELTQLMGEVTRGRCALLMGDIDKARVDIVTGISSDHVQAGDSIRLYRAFTLSIDRPLVSYSVSTTLQSLDEAHSAWSERHIMAQEDLSSHRLALTAYSGDDADDSSEASAEAFDAVIPYPFVAGAFFPLGEYDDIIQLNEPSSNWRALCALLLKVPVDSIESVLLPGVIVYFVRFASSMINRRLVNYCATAIGVLHAFPQQSAALCLFRSPAAEVVFRQWLSSYALEIEAQREAQRLTIIDNHSEYCNFIDTLVDLFEVPLYATLHCRLNAPKNNAHASLAQTRLLVSRFLSAVKSSTEKVLAVNLHQHGDISRLYECYIGQNQMTKMNSIPCILQRENSTVSAHVFYRLCRRHVHGCTNPLSFCTFPGCCRVRQGMAAGKDELDEVLSMDITSDLFHRELLLYTVELGNGPGLAALDHEEKKNRTETKSEDVRVLALRYRGAHRKLFATRADAALSFSEMCPLMDSTNDENKDNLVDAKDCIGYKKDLQEDERGMSALYIDLVPAAVVWDMRPHLQNRMPLSKNFAIGAEEYKVEGTAPPRDQQTETAAWLISRLTLSLPNETSCYKFDRLLAIGEGEWLGASSRVSVEVYYGVLNPPYSKIEEFSRQLPTMLLHDLQPGLSIYVSDPVQGLSGGFSVPQGATMEFLMRMMGIHIASSDGRQQMFQAVADTVIAQGASLFKKVSVGHGCVEIYMSSTAGELREGHLLSSRDESIRVSKMRLQKKPAQGQVRQVPLFY